MSKTGVDGTHITVEVVHHDSTFTVIGEAFQELGAAAFFALRLADDLGRTMTPFSDGPSFPRSVVIRRGNVIEWEILVFLGGLSPEPPFEGELKLPQPHRRPV